MLFYQKGDGEAGAFPMTIVVRQEDESPLLSIISLCILTCDGGKDRADGMVSYISYLTPGRPVLYTALWNAFEHQPGSHAWSAFKTQDGSGPEWDVSSGREMFVNHPDLNAHLERIIADCVFVYCHNLLPEAEEEYWLYNGAPH